MCYYQSYACYHTVKKVFKIWTLNLILFSQISSPKKLSIVHNDHVHKCLPYTCICFDSGIKCNELCNFLSEVGKDTQSADKTVSDCGCNLIPTLLDKVTLNSVELFLYDCLKHSVYGLYNMCNRFSNVVFG